MTGSPRDRRTFWRQRQRLRTRRMLRRRGRTILLICGVIAVLALLCCGGIVLGHGIRA